MAAALKDEEDMFRLKARAHCLLLGEGNFHIFHATYNSCCSTNYLGSIRCDDGSFTDDPTSIKLLVVQFFQHLYNINSIEIAYSTACCKSLSQEALEAFNQPISLEELDEIVKDSDPDKAPSPDGLTMGLYKDHWPLIRNEAWKSVENFFSIGKLLKSISHI